MFMLLLISIIILYITLIVLLVGSILSKKPFINREKNSPFVCEFDPKCSVRMFFFLHFSDWNFFLVYDVEIAMLLPIIIIMNTSNYIRCMLVTFVFLIILLKGLYHQLYQGALN